MDAIQKIKAEINRQLEELGMSGSVCVGRSVLLEMRDFVNSLEKEPEPQGLEEAKLKSEIEWEWVHREKQETDFIPCAEMDKDEFIRFAKKFFEIGKDAGAKWMAEQGIVEETRIITNPYNHLKGVAVTLGLESFDFDDNEPVIVQIRKNESTSEDKI